MAISLFWDRQESYHHICIITDKFLYKAWEPVIITVVKQLYVFLSHYLVSLTLFWQFKTDW